MQFYWYIFIILTHQLEFGGVKSILQPNKTKHVTKEFQFLMN